MDWPELVEALKPLGFREFYEGHRMYHEEPEDLRRVYGIFNGGAEVTDFSADVLSSERRLFVGPFAEVVEYLQKVEKEKKP